MSRVSLNRRLEAVLAAAERIDPRAVSVHRMEPALRMHHDLWRGECRRLIDDIKRESGPGAAFAAMLDGTLATPPPPRVVAEALGLSDAPRIPAETSVTDVAEIYAAMVTD